jgi:hypothetical protein
LGTGGFGGVAFDDDDQIVLVGLDGARTFDLQQPVSEATRAVPLGTDAIEDLAFAPDGALVAVTAATDGVQGAGRLATWDPRADRDPLAAPLAMRGTRVAVDPQGRYAAITGWAERLAIVDLASGVVRDLPTPNLTPRGVAFTPDGSPALVLGARLRARRRIASGRTAPGIPGLRPDGHRPRGVNVGRTVRWPARVGARRRLGRVDHLRGRRRSDLGRDRARRTPPVRRPR